MLVVVTQLTHPGVRGNVHPTALSCAGAFNVEAGTVQKVVEWTLLKPCYSKEPPPLYETKSVQYLCANHNAFPIRSIH
jgi:hypothetical protein